MLSELAAYLRPKWRRHSSQYFSPRPAGVSVVIPSRNGRELLAAQLPGICAQSPAEIIVVDNGSDDGTAAWLARAWSAVRVIVSPEPLSFARAVNRGIREARYAHICLLNNDMLIEPEFFAALQAPFARTRDLFCATAQIRFPEGVRREETGKAVMAQSKPDDYPIRCDEPLPGEDGTWVLYGSGGCSLYDAAKLDALGNVDEAYEPAYVEDLDLGYRAWVRGWPSVYVAGAIVEHRHRATTSRYFTESQLEDALELNYLRFLVRAVSDRALFLGLWRQALTRLRDKPHILRQAWRIPLEGGEFIDPSFPEEAFLELTNGCAAIFPGVGTGSPRIAVVPELAPPQEERLRQHSAVLMIRAPEDSAAVRLARQLLGVQ